MMKKYTFDAKNGLWYEQCGEYQLPCLNVPNSKSIGIWGQRHRRYLHQHKYSTAFLSLEGLTIKFINTPRLF